MEQKHSDRFTDEELIEAYKITPFLGKLSVKFNVPNITIFRRAERLGLKFKNGGNNDRFPLTEILDGLHPQYPTLKLKKRLIKEGLKQNICEECGIKDWNKKPIELHLDHIDGNSHNHALDNLRILCPNCHSQTNTWCGKNILR